MRYFYRMSTVDAMKVSHIVDGRCAYNPAMRTNGILCTLVALVALGACILNGAAEAQELWNGLQIGESKGAILHRYPDAKSSVDREIPGVRPRGQSLAVEDFGSDQCSLVVRFVFPDGQGLDAVHVTTAENMLAQPNEIRTRCAKEIFEALQQKYGAPDVSERKDDMDMTVVVWHRPGGVNIEYDDQRSLGTFVSYSTRKLTNEPDRREKKSAL